MQTGRRLKASSKFTKKKGIKNKRYNNSNSKFVEELVTLLNIILR